MSKKLHDDAVSNDSSNTSSLMKIINSYSLRKPTPTAPPKEFICNKNPSTPVKVSSASVLQRSPRTYTKIQRIRTDNKLKSLSDVKNYYGSLGFQKDATNSLSSESASDILDDDEDYHNREVVKGSENGDNRGIEIDDDTEYDNTEADDDDEDVGTLDGDEVSLVVGKKTKKMQKNTSGYHRLIVNALFTLLKATFDYYTSNVNKKVVLSFWLYVIEEMSDTTYSTGMQSTHVTSYSMQ
jgi:hypothetical protein